MFQPNSITLLMTVTLDLKRSSGFSNFIRARSQEETTTEANTRSIVRNQPYEIF